MVKPVGTLGGIQIDAMTRHDTVTGLREGVLVLRDVPGAPPAHATLSQLTVNPLGLIAQLEHRVNSLAELRQSTATRQQAAEQEAVRAREALARPFKYAEQLTGAARRLAEINQQMTNRPSAPGTPRDANATTQTPDPPAVTEPVPVVTWRPVPPQARVCRDAELSSPGRYRDAGR